jgi:glutaredoxin
MLNDKRITFRCKGGSHVLFTPEYLHDVEGMRKHPEYEEVTLDEHGNVAAVIVQPEALVQRPHVFVEPAPAPKAPTPKRKGK